MTNKKFDCVEMKRHAQEIIYSQTKSMSKEQLLYFWNERAESFKKEISERKTVITKRRKLRQSKHQPD